MRNGGKPGHAGHLTDHVGKYVGGERRVGRHGAFGVVGVVAVEAEDRVEVDQAASLELGDLGVGQLDPHAMLTGELVEVAADADDGAAPQLGAWAFHTTVAL